VVPTGTDAEVLPAQEGSDIFELDPNWTWSSAACRQVLQERVTAA